MSTLLDFFDCSSELKDEQISGGQTHCADVGKEGYLPFPDLEARRFTIYSFDEKFNRREKLNIIEVAKDHVNEMTMGRDPSRAPSQLRCIKKVTLPIDSKKSTIVKTINSTSVCILQGRTGCGKSTQVAQFILDSCRAKNVPCNIVVTQPRRIAAISLARRVCEERKWPLGALVGYQVGLDSEHCSEFTRLLYCTTGVLLHRLIGEKSLGNITHIILDEVHERSQDMDFLIFVVKRLLALKSKDVKVILMSATFNVNHFADYFPIVSGDSVIPSPIIELGSMENPFDTKIVYLNHLDQLMPHLPSIELNEPGITLLGYQTAMAVIQGLDDLEAKCHWKISNKQRGAVLVFLPGIYEIEEFYNMLMVKEKDLKWWIKPLHSSLTSAEQDVIFTRPPEYHRKIILSTNLAESSITLPDIMYVVDFVLTKKMVCDLNTGLQSLRLEWASKSSCTQRSGRTGRVASGYVFRLVPDDFFQNLDENDTPEMQRSSLECTVLLTKQLKMGPPASLLALTLDPPDLRNVDRSIMLLKEKGALLSTSNGRPSLTDGDITFLGIVMSKLPVDPTFSRLIVLGHVFSVLHECIVMAAAMTIKSVFSTPFKERREAYESKLVWASSTCSDSIAFLKAYEGWVIFKERHRRSGCTPGAEDEWAHRQHIQIQNMYEVDNLVRDIESRLSQLSIKVPAGEGRVTLTVHEKLFVLKIVLAGAFYPNYFESTNQDPEDKLDALKLMNGRDPLSTVYLQGFPCDQPRRLYAQSIKDQFLGCSKEVHVTFDTSSKVFIEFNEVRTPGVVLHQRKRPLINPGSAAMALYRAVKLRRLNIPITIPLLSPEEAHVRAKDLGLENFEIERYNAFSAKVEVPDIKNYVPNRPPPGLDVARIELKITRIKNAGNFWAQSADSETSNNLEYLETTLKSEEHLETLVGLPIPGRVYASIMARKPEDQYYRVRVESINLNQKEPVVKLRYIDYGHWVTRYSDYLMDFKEDVVTNTKVLKIPPLAFKCALANILPSPILSDRGMWTADATDAVNQVSFGKNCVANIFSVVDGVVRLEIFYASNISINDLLVQRKFAVYAEESYHSMENNKLRNHGSKSSFMHCCDELQSLKIESDNLEPYVKSPTKEECTTIHKLRGPFSTLEINLSSLTNVGSRQIITHGDSVNSILLNAYPYESSKRLLIAASLGETVTREKIALRHTTLMPNIRGLTALVSMIFAPTMELRINSQRTRNIGAICGLGMDLEMGMSIFPEHDMEITFDFEMDNQTIYVINELRFAMNKCLVPEESDGMHFCPETVQQGQKDSYTKLRWLMEKVYPPCEKEINPSWKEWGLVNPDFLIPHTNHSIANTNPLRDVFSLHKLVHLKANEEDRPKFIEKLKRAKYLR